MKILIVTPDIYDNELNSDGQTITGIAKVVRDILDELKNEIEIYVFSSKIAYENKDLKGIQLLRSVPKISDLFDFKILKIILLSLRKSVPISELKIKIHKCVKNRLFEKYLSKINPSVVNFHDLGLEHIPLIDLAADRGYRTLVTDHLYIGKSPVYLGYDKLAESERYVFQKKNIHVSFVSNGMLSRFKCDYPCYPSNYAHVILNGTPECNDTNDSNNEKLKKILCIGTICDRKNQKLLVDVISKYKTEIPDDVEFHFIGKDLTGSFKDYIKSKDCKKIFYDGIISHEVMAEWYQKSYATISVSLNESFGLTIIEGYKYGKPAIFFGDIDSCMDLYDENVCITINEHTEIAIFRAIKECVSKEWEVDYIRKFSKKYSMKETARLYLSLYKDISTNNN